MPSAAALCADAAADAARITLTVESTLRPVDGCVAVTHISNGRGERSRTMVAPMRAAGGMPGDGTRAAWVCECG